MIVVPRQNTPVLMSAMPSLVDKAFQDEGTRLSKNQVINLASLVAIETGRGKSVQNWNLGNLTAGESYSGKVWRPPWFEVTDTSSERDKSLHKLMLEGKAPSAFRAYDSVQIGAKDFAKFLLKPTYAGLMKAANGSDSDNYRLAIAERYSKDYLNPKVTDTLIQLRSEFGGVPETRTRSILPLLTGAGLLVTLWYVGKNLFARGSASSRVPATNRE